MKVRNDEDQRLLLAISVWENEGGASGQDSADELYGRRVEADRSWTVYHVFTGVPAQADGKAMTGLSRLNATDRMLLLNRSNVQGRKDRTKLICTPGMYNLS